MIVVLFNSFEEAQDGYDMFVSFLEENDPWSIRQTYNASYCVETDDDLRYVFIDHRMEPIFRAFEMIDEIGGDEFFANLSEKYPEYY